MTYQPDPRATSGTVTITGELTVESMRALLAGLLRRDVQPELALRAWLEWVLPLGGGEVTVKAEDIVSWASAHE